MEKETSKKISKEYDENCESPSSYKKEIEESKYLRPPHKRDRIGNVNYFKLEKQ